MMTRRSVARTAAVCLLFALARSASAQVAWRETPHLPLSRLNFALGSDPVRGRVVLFGGGSFELTNDTWEWDGTTWRRFFPRHSPSPRAGAKMVYDPVGGRMILFGGVLDFSDWSLSGETWAWDGHDWTELEPAQSPSPRAFYAFDVDPLRKELVLYGGGVPPAGFFGLTSDDETWIWDGATWVQRFPATNPVVNQFGELAFCGASQRLVLQMPMSPVTTWEWSGFDWISHPNSGSPIVSSDDFDIAADPRTGEVVLWKAGKNNPRETWTWAGQQWVRVASTTNTLQGASGETAVDWSSNQVVWFGQSDTGTWRWNGVAWSLVQDQAPKERYLIAWDSTRDEFVMVEDYAFYQAPPERMETWLMDDSGLREVAVGAPPNDNVGYRSLVHDPVSGMTLLQGGVQQSPFALVSETWLWDGSRWQREPTVGPVNALCAYDSRRRKVVAIAWDGLVWEWSHRSGWSVQSGAAPLPFLSSALDGLAYDSGRGLLVVLAQNTLWEFDGASWVMRAPRVTGKIAQSPQILYAPALGGIVAFDDESELWIWDGSEWRTEPVVVPGETVFSSTYDAGRERIVLLFRRIIGTTTSPSTGSIWELSDRRLVPSQRYPRLGETVSLDFTWPTQANAPFVLGFSDTPGPGIPLIPDPWLPARRFPLGLGPLLDASLQANLTGWLDPLGRASFPLRIPNASALLGFRLHAAALTVDQTGAIGEISNRTELWIDR